STRCSPCSTDSPPQGASMPETTYETTGVAPGNRPMIRLERLSKSYPQQPVPAVENLTMDIPEGEIVVFVGPSGCGKTTTMKLINRLIEPTMGRVFLEDTDVTQVNPDRLRRKI